MNNSPSEQNQSTKYKRGQFVYMFEYEANLALQLYVCTHSKMRSINEMGKKKSKMQIFSPHESDSIKIQV